MAGLRASGCQKRPQHCLRSWRAGFAATDDNGMSADTANPAAEASGMSAASRFRGNSSRRWQTALIDVVTGQQRSHQQNSGNSSSSMRSRLGLWLHHPQQRPQLGQKSVLQQPGMQQQTLPLYLQQQQRQIAPANCRTVVRLIDWGSLSSISSNSSSSQCSIVLCHSSWISHAPPPPLLPPPEVHQWQQRQQQQQQ